MFNVWSDYKNYLSRAKSQASRSMNFTFNKMTDVFTDIMGKYVPEFAQEVKLNLPNLATNIKLPTLKKKESTKQTMEI